MYEFVTARKPPTPAVPRYNPASVYAPSVARKSRDSKDSRFHQLTGFISVHIFTYNLYLLITLNCFL